MRAAVVGIGWGQVHVAALREAGVEVVAVCGSDLDRTQAFAAGAGIPVALAGVSELPRLGLDLITIAAPTPLHAGIVAELGPTPIICEKPAVGVESAVAEVPRPRGPVWVNYAFGFLDVVREAEAVLAARNADGPVSVEVVSSHDLGGLVAGGRGPWQWFADVATHPWSWAVSRFGAPTTQPRGGVSRNAAAAWLRYEAAAGHLVSVTTEHSPGFNGLRHEVAVRDSIGEVRFAGQFHLGQNWVFGPVLVDGTALDASGHPADRGRWRDRWPIPGVRRDERRGGTDPWYLANAAAICAVVRELRGEAGADGARPFTWERALAMDAVVQQVAHLP